MKKVSEYFTGPTKRCCITLPEPLVDEVLEDIKKKNKLLTKSAAIKFLLLKYVEEESK